MVSRRNYFAITLVMAVVFLLFQSVNAAQEYQNRYEENAYAETDKTLPVKSDAYNLDTLDFNALNKDVVVYIGGEKDDPIKDTVTNWCVYSKRVLMTYPSLTEYETANSNTTGKRDVMLVNSDYLDFGDSDDTRLLCSYAEEGTVLGFCNLPDASVMSENKTLRKLLGIADITAAETTVQGIHLFQGLLLGGEMIYQAETEEEQADQDMDVTFPWYRLGAGTKVYMKGIPADKTIEKEEYPVVIWRNSYEGTAVFAVNGDYMEGQEGIGILSGFMAEANPYALYPVVNAQNMVIANFPGLADENEEELQKYYSRSMSGLFRDVIWPEVEAIYRRNSFGLTCMLQPQFDYSDENLPVGENLKYYLKSTNELGGETGVSGSSKSETDAERKLAEDAAFFREEIPNYQFTSLYVGDLDDREANEAVNALGSIRTVVAAYGGGSEVIGYQNETVTRQNAVIDGFSHTYREDFRVKSIESALGYTSVLVDMERVAYPETDEDLWQKLAKDFSSYTDTYWNSYQNFDGTTATECDERIRSFLALDYQDRLEGDKISLDISGEQEQAWFLLRTHHQSVKNVTGGDFVKIEDDVFLIEANEDNVIIWLQPSDQRKYYVS